MKISFSRKGFDSAAGGVPSPIIDGRPISLPIPTQRRSVTRYDDIGLGSIVERVTRGRISGQHLCHRDPVFQDSRCAFGQIAAAQSHLAKHSFGVGDVFLFFGLFADENGRDRHHRIFGYLHVSEKIALGPEPFCPPCLDGLKQKHPHTIGEWNDNNTLYFGHGNAARNASDVLRLSKHGGPVSIWQTPDWLRSVDLSYHSNPARWTEDDVLRVASRGQEFVTSDISSNAQARRWVDDVIRNIDGASSQ